MILSLISLGVDDSNVWRALAVAALAVSAFALNRYRQSLAEHTRRRRLSLVALRAVSFLLLICALAGVRLDYESSSPGRVLLRHARAEGLSAQGKADGAVVERAIAAALRSRGFNPAPSTDAGIYTSGGSEEGIRGGEGLKAT